MSYIIQIELYNIGGFCIFFPVAIVFSHNLLPVDFSLTVSLFYAVHDSDKSLYMGLRTLYIILVLCTWT